MKKLYNKVAALLLCAGISFSFTSCTDYLTEISNNTGSSSAITEMPATEGTAEKSAETAVTSAEITNDTEQMANESLLTTTYIPELKAISISLTDIPEYSGKAYVVINDNVPFFGDDELITNSFEQYSPLDRSGRCGTAFACIGKDIMPTEERGQIGSIKPTGWNTVKYDNVDGKYLYNRCHLIGYQLCAENANEKNLITGTRYLNVQGMLPFENMTADYINETDNHVMYRVTPMFNGNNLLANGVLMEGYSVEDNGEGICFCVFCYNIQPNIIIDYTDGSSKEKIVTTVAETTTTVATTTTKVTETTTTVSKGTTYILNTNTKKFHYTYCSSVKQMKDKNKKEYTGDREDVISQGYSPCKRCNP